jgi:hypothetical protein
LEDLKKAIARHPEGDWRGKLTAWAKAGTIYLLEEAPIHDLVFYEYQPSSPKEDIENIVIVHLSGLLEAGTDAVAGTRSLRNCDSSVSERSDWPRAEDVNQADAFLPLNSPFHPDWRPLEAPSNGAE